MSFVLDSVSRIDAQIDKSQLVSINAASSPTASRVSSWSGSPKDNALKLPARILALQSSVRALSVAGFSDEKAVLQPRRICSAVEILLSEQGQQSLDGAGSATDLSEDQYEQELEWLVVSKATALAYGVVVKTILDEAVGLVEDVWYWDDLISSRRWTAIYSLQTSPLRLWDWTSMIWQDVRSRGGQFSLRSAGQDAQESMTKRWTDFYSLVRRVVREQSVAEFQKQALTPITRLRSEMKKNQTALKKIRLRNANALGVLLGEGLANESVHNAGLLTPQSDDDVDLKWRKSVARNIALMEAILSKVNDQSLPIAKFDTAIAELTDEDPLGGRDQYSSNDLDEANTDARAVAVRIDKLMLHCLPRYLAASKQAKADHAKPAFIVRYWPAIALGVVSSSTVLRILVRRQADILKWLQDFGTTTVDFWRNWVIEPLNKVIKTIRHDEDSQLSLMSKRSLEGDRDSLERMVVEFAIDNPQNATGSSAKLTEIQIADIRSRVKEGDLTPVLKAYERDLRSPFMGTVRGDLIRALLIQVQKTKVDVEVAIGGIDNLLKSQELVFGFVGLTPGILVTYYVLKWLSESISEKKGSKAAQKRGNTTRQLRNIDRILTNSPPTEFGELYYRDQGLLLCEAHVLREEARRIMSEQIFREFADDIGELCDVRSGVERQKRVVERLRWAYSRYL